MCRLIDSGASQSKLLEAAEAVRDARIRVARAKQAEIGPRDLPELREAIAKLQQRIDSLQATPSEAILAEFQPW